MAAQYNQNLTFAGLGTLSITLPMDGSYFFEGKISLPTLSKGDSAPSALVVTVNQNGSPVYVGQAGAEGFKVQVNGVLGDVIAMVFSSAADVDQGLNVIKSVISIGLGE